jgi:hypothetical protein
MTVDQLVEAIETALRENAERVITTGAGEAQLLARVGQVDYALIIRGERVVQFFPSAMTATRRKRAQFATTHSRSLALRTPSVRLRACIDGLQLVEPHARAPDLDSCFLLQSAR